MIVVSRRNFIDTKVILFGDCYSKLFSRVPWFDLLSIVMINEIQISLCRAPNTSNQIYRLSLTMWLVGVNLEYLEEANSESVRSSTSDHRLLPL